MIGCTIRLARMRNRFFPKNRLTATGCTQCGSMTRLSHFEPLMKALLLVGLSLWIGLVPVMSVRAQEELLSENFNNPAAASQRFTTFGNVQFTGHDVRIPSGSAIFLNAANAVPDTDAYKIRYSILQSFEPGTLSPGIWHDASFYVRVPVGSLIDGYSVGTVLTSQGPFINVRRRNIPGYPSLGGGSRFAPPALGTLGPYEMTVTVWDTPEAVHIEVMVGGVHAITVTDSGPGRITSGGLVGFENSGSYGAFVDSLSVTTVVPEPGSTALLLLGLIALALTRPLVRRR